MAETVKEELERKLRGAQAALSEVEITLKRHIDEKEILEHRVHDLRAALSGLEPVVCNTINIGAIK